MTKKKVMMMMMMLMGDDYDYDNDHDAEEDERRRRRRRTTTTTRKIMTKCASDAGNTYTNAHGGYGPANYDDDVDDYYYDCDTLLKQSRLLISESCPGTSMKWHVRVLTGH